MSDQISRTDTPLIQRKVAFDFSATPLHWIPDDPFSSQFISVIHTLLPAGEFFFCRLYNKALPHISDPKLRHDVQGFIRQEAAHARAHTSGISEYLEQHGMELKPVLDKVSWIFNVALADRPLGFQLPAALEKRWLVERLGIIAAVEHFTCVLGKYALENRTWEAAGADDVVLDILRWHAAEEVEHRSVAFDVYRHLGGSYFMRYPQMLITVPGILGMWIYAAVHLMQQDPLLARRNPRIAGRFFWRQWQNRARARRLPSLAWLVLSATRYFRPDYDPVAEADSRQAMDYLDHSPAARRAAAMAHAA